MYHPNLLITALQQTFQNPLARIAAEISLPVGLWVTGHHAAALFAATIPGYEIQQQLNDTWQGMYRENLEPLFLIEDNHMIINPDVVGSIEPNEGQYLMYFGKELMVQAHSIDDLNEIANQYRFSSQDSWLTKLLHNLSKKTVKLYEDPVKDSILSKLLMPDIDDGNLANSKKKIEFYKESLRLLIKQEGFKWTDVAINLKTDDINNLRLSEEEQSHYNQYLWNVLKQQ